jgi:hypothetical protein
MDEEYDSLAPQGVFRLGCGGGRPASYFLNFGLHPRSDVANELKNCLAVKAREEWPCLCDCQQLYSSLLVIGRFMES